MDRALGGSRVNYFNIFYHKARYSPYYRWVAKASNYDRVLATLKRRGYTILDVTSQNHARTYPKGDKNVPSTQVND